MNLLHDMQSKNLVFNSLKEIRQKLYEPNKAQSDNSNIDEYALNNIPEASCGPCSKHSSSFLPELVFPDPQTNGGLLIAVSKEKKEELIEKLKEEGLSDHLQSIGRLTELGERRMVVGGVM